MNDIVRSTPVPSGLDKAGVERFPAVDHYPTITCMHDILINICEKNKAQGGKDINKQHIKVPQFVTDAEEILCGLIVGKPSPKSQTSRMIVISEEFDNLSISPSLYCYVQL